MFNSSTALSYLICDHCLSSQISRVLYNMQRYLDSILVTLWV